MIPLLMIMGACNGKYFLINTNDNNNTNGQDYMMNGEQAGCLPATIYPTQEAACKRREVLGFNKLEDLKNISQNFLINIYII